VTTTSCDHEDEWSLEFVFDENVWSLCSVRSETRYP
jgi:hypothetical protein